MSKKEETTQRTLYELLGVSPNATQAEIKKAFKFRSQKMHPDKGGSEEAYAEVRKAYKILSNKEARYRYDTSELQGVSYEEFNSYLSGIVEAMTEYLIKQSQNEQGGLTPETFRVFFDLNNTEEQTNINIARVYSRFLTQSKKGIEGELKKQKRLQKITEKLRKKFKNKENTMYEALQKREIAAAAAIKTAKTQQAAIDFVHIQVKDLSFFEDTKKADETKQLFHQNVEWKER